MLPGLEDAGAQARRLEALGVDGLFTFEGPRDVFMPLVLAATDTSTVAPHEQRGHRLPP